MVCMFCRVFEKDIGNDAREEAMEGKAFCKYAVLPCPEPAGPSGIVAEKIPFRRMERCSGTETGVEYAFSGF